MADDTNATSETKTEEATASPTTEKKPEEVQDTVKNELFKGVQFSLCDNVENAEEVKKILVDDGAKFCHYLADNVTHFIANSDDHPDATTAVDIYEKPVVTSRWVHLSKAANTLLPITAFSPSKEQLFSGIVACPSKLSIEDVNVCWAMITYNGGSFQTKLTPQCTHLIAAKPEGTKYERAMATNGKITIVTPDWVVNTYKERRKSDTDFYHPKLLLSPTQQKPFTQTMVPQSTSISNQQNETTSIANIQFSQQNIIVHQTPGMQTQPGPRYILLSGPQNIRHVITTDSQGNIQQGSDPRGIRPQYIVSHQQMVSQVRAPQQRQLYFMPPGGNAQQRPQLIQMDGQNNQQVQQIHIQQPGTNQPQMVQQAQQNQGMRQQQPNVQYQQQIPSGRGNVILQKRIQPPIAIAGQSQQMMSQQPMQQQHPMQQHNLQQTSNIQMAQQQQGQQQQQVRMQSQQMAFQRPQVNVQTIRGPHPQQQQQQIMYRQPVQMQNQQQPQMYAQPPIQQQPQIQQVPMQQQQSMQVQRVPQLRMQAMAPGQQIRGQQMRQVNPHMQGGQVIQTQPDGSSIVIRGFPPHQMQPQQMDQNQTQMVRQVSPRQAYNIRPQGNWQVDGQQRMVRPLQPVMAAPQQQQQAQQQMHWQQQQQQQQNQMQMPRGPPPGARMQAPSLQRFPSPHQVIPDGQVRPSMATMIRPSQPLPSQTQQRHPIPPHQQSPLAGVQNVAGAPPMTPDLSHRIGHLLEPPPPPQERYYGHESAVKVEPELCFIGCVFYIVGDEKDYTITSSCIRRVCNNIRNLGGEVEESYTPRVTHVIATNTDTVVIQALKDLKRVVTLHYVNDVMKETKKLRPPWKVYHLPYAHSIIAKKPLKGHRISSTGFTTHEKMFLKEMVTLAGGEFNQCLSKYETFLICKRLEGAKYEKAMGWSLSTMNVVNATWLFDVYFQVNDPFFIPMASNPRYKKFDLKDAFEVDQFSLRHLLVGWRSVIPVPQELYAKLRDEKTKAREALKEDNSAKQKENIAEKEILNATDEIKNKEPLPPTAPNEEKAAVVDHDDKSNEENIPVPPVAVEVQEQVPVNPSAKLDEDKTNSTNNNDKEDTEDKNKDDNNKEHVEPTVTESKDEGEPESKRAKLDEPEPMEADNRAENASKPPEQEPSNISLDNGEKESTIASADVTASNEDVPANLPPPPPLIKCGNLVVPATTPSPPHHPRPLVKIMLTGLNKDEEEKYTAIAKRLGATVVKSPQKCTHLVSKYVLLTENFVTGLNYTNYVLSTSWLDHCDKVNKIEADFCKPENAQHFLVDKVFEASAKINVQDALKIRQQRETKLLENCTFFVTKGIRHKMKSTMKAIIESAGGTCVTDRPPSTDDHIKLTQKGVRFFVISDKDDMKQPYYKKYFDRNWDIVSPDFVIFAVLRQSLDIEPYRIKRVN